MRVLHVVVRYDCYEGTGRSVVEIARRLHDVEPMLLTNELLNGGEEFAKVVEVGGRATSFHLTRQREIRRMIADTGPDLVHLHGGVLTAFLAHAFPREVPVVLSMLAWPRLGPVEWRELRGAAFRDARAGEALRARTLVASAVPGPALRASLRRGPVKAVVSPDAELIRHLAATGGVVARHAPGGGAVDGGRAIFDPVRPTVVFAGRAERARGIDVLVDAFPSVLRQHPGAMLRLCLLPGADADLIAEQVSSSPAAANIELTVGAVPDLRALLRSATVGAFPFKFAYTTPVPPLAVTEAMSVGLPVVVTPVRCIAPVVGADSAVVVPVADAEATAAAITSILTDQVEWARLSDGAYETIARRWNWDVAASVVRGVYQEALGAP